MTGVNRVTLLGNLGKDPELKTFENGAKLVRFSIATNEKYTSKAGEKITKTDWHNIAVWRGLAEAAEKLLKKGSYVYLEGKLRNRAYQDKEGNTKYAIEIEAENFTLLNRTDAERAAGQAEEALVHANTPGYGPDAEGDLPF